MDYFCVSSLYKSCFGDQLTDSDMCCALIQADFTPSSVIGTCAQTYLQGYRCVILHCTCS